MQTLFGENTISFEQAATLLGVSQASVRNWVNEGLLQKVTSNLLDGNSVKTFQTEQVGSEKLNKRANKSAKDSHNHSQLTAFVDKMINDEGCGRRLAQEYENSLSESYRNKEGIYYTPKAVVADMLRNMADVTADKTFLEPCCGTGEFVVEAIAAGVNPDNIYAFDTDENAVKITQKRIYDLTGRTAPHIYCADFLTIARRLPIKFDYIYTNPPWGRKMERQYKKQAGSLFLCGDNADSATIFFMACCDMLKEGGKLGFLLPESFFNIASFETARQAALSRQIDNLTDYGKVFKGLMTKAQAIMLTNVKPQEAHEVCCKVNNTLHRRTQAGFSRMPKQILNFWSKEEDFFVLDHLFNVATTTLRGCAKWAMGIVTGDNKRVLKDSPAEGLVPIYRGKEIKPDGLSQPNLYIDRNLNGCRQVADTKIYRHKGKLIYRFISDKLVFYHDVEGVYVLNSANILIPDESLGISASQLASLLNGDFMNWVYRSVFNTTKVLRGDLEALPLCKEYFVENKEFEEKRYMAYLQIEQRDGTYRIKRQANL